MEPNECWIQMIRKKIHPIIWTSCTVEMYEGFHIQKWWQNINLANPSTWDYKSEENSQTLNHEFRYKKQEEHQR